MTDEKQLKGVGALLGKNISRREAIKLGAAGSGAVVFSMYVKPAMQGIGVARAAHGTPTNGNGGKCNTPGYWKNHTDDWPTQYTAPDGTTKSISTTDLFTDHFVPTGHVSAFAGMSLLVAVNADATPKGGCPYHLGRHAIAALLNASSGMLFGLNPATVINLTNDAFAGDTGDCNKIENQKNEFDTLNNESCVAEGGKLAEP